MKIFCFSFIVYLVLILTQPCQDLVAITDDCYGDETHVTHVENAPQNDTEGDKCPPFCICSCCSHPVASHNFTFVVTSEIEQVSIPNALIKYVNVYAESHQNSVWQPPKV